jgi:sensor c-di-GMP phosphodiesterase-like protein
MPADGRPHVIDVKLLAADGIVFGARPPESSGPGDPGEMFTVHVRSRPFGMIVTTAIGRARVMAEHRDLVAMAVLGTGTVALMILILGFGAARRPDDPVSVLRQAIHAGELVPHYQPIVDLTTARVVSAEVLVRWRKPDGTVVQPAAFIPLAESSGLIIDLTRQLMQRVCQEVGPALGARPHLKIGFNLTARHFANEEIVGDVRRIFKKSALRLSQVVLEVTERQPLENLTETRRVVAALQGLGARVAIDDVGTGHSGLSYMLKLGVDIIKIDKMFIDSLGTDRNSNTIIETLIDLAQNMRMEVIAEGVETFEQVVHLRELGIRAAQGFVFAPPLPTQAFLQLVDTVDPIKPGTARATDEESVALPVFAQPNVA